MADGHSIDDAIREGEPPLRSPHSPSPPPDMVRPKLRWALTSLALGLVSIALIPIPPGFFVQLLHPWLGDYLPLFFFFLAGALAGAVAFGLGLGVMIRGRRFSWLALGGIILGTVGMLLWGVALAVLTVYMFLRGPVADPPGQAGAMQPLSVKFAGLEEVARDHVPKTGSGAEEC